MVRPVSSAICWGRRSSPYRDWISSRDFSGSRAETLRVHPVCALRESIPAGQTPRSHAGWLRRERARKPRLLITALQQFLRCHARAHAPKGRAGRIREPLPEHRRGFLKHIVDSRRVAKHARTNARRSVSAANSNRKNSFWSLTAVSSYLSFRQASQIYHGGGHSCLVNRRPQGWPSIGILLALVYSFTARPVGSPRSQGVGLAKAARRYAS